MDSKTRRYWKRRRPIVGTKVIIKDHGRDIVGVVSQKQFQWAGRTQVRIDYDNGQYVTWTVIPIDVALKSLA